MNICISTWLEDIDNLFLVRRTPIKIKVKIKVYSILYTGTPSPAVVLQLLEANNHLWRHQTKIKITIVTTNLRHTSTDIPSLAIYRVCRFIPHYVPALGY